jgi:L-threonylcarbamoyladenylate synthase
MDRPSDVVRRGGIIVYPTETFYGLGGLPEVERVIERIFYLKGREFNKPLPLIAEGLGSARGAVQDWPEAAQRLADVFWPGPLTLVLPAARKFPPRLHAHTGRVAIRVSSHPVARLLAQSVGGLLISTSANRSGEDSCSDLGQLPRELERGVDGIVDSGSLPGGMPSTIVDLAEGPPRLVRQGCVPWVEIQSVLRRFFE